MNCPNCGEKVAKKYDFCLVCGSSLHAQTEKTTASLNIDVSTVRKRLTERFRQVTAQVKKPNAPQQTQQTEQSVPVQDDRIMPDFMTHYL